MSTHQEPSNDKNGNGDDRIAEPEERLAALEEALRLREIEDRVGDLEAGANDDDPEGPPPEPEGQKAMRLAVAQFLNNENTAKAVSDLLTTLGSTIKEWTGLKTKELQNHKSVTLWSYFGGLAFNAFLLVILTVLLWHDKITKERELSVGVRSAETIALSGGKQVKLFGNSLAISNFSWFDFSLILATKECRKFLYVKCLANITPPLAIENGNGQRLLVRNRWWFGPG